MNQTQKISFAGMFAVIAVIVFFCAQIVDLGNQGRTVRLSISASNALSLSLASLESDLKDLETSQRGFLLTGDNQYLAHYNLSAQDLQERLAFASAALHQEHIFSADTDLLNSLMAKKLAELNKTIALYKSGNAEESIAIVKSHNGKAIMDKIHSWLADIDPQVERFNANQNKLLDEIASRRLSKILLSTTISIFFLSILMFLLFLSNRKIRDYSIRIVEKETFLAATLNSLPILVAYIDKDLKYRYINMAYQHLRGASGPIYIGQYLVDVIGPVVFERIRPYVAGVLKGQKQVFETIFPKHTPENDAIIHVTYIPDVKEGGRVEGFYALINDITALKMAETKIIHASKMASLGEMAGGIAHEINTPLAIIHGKAEQLRLALERGSVPTEKIRDGLLRIENTTLRIAQIIKGLRSFSRESDADRMETISLAKIFEDTLAFCKERFRSCSIELMMTGNLEVEIECRGSQISQVILNLMNNAHDAIENLPKRWIAVDVQRLEKNVQIFITDSGSGIPTAVAEKMMQPFFTTKEVGRGTGLGLSISSGIARAHRGSLKYDSLCLNTRFVLLLPLRQTPLGADGVKASRNRELDFN